MNTQHIRFRLILLLALSTGLLRADVELPALFSDHMVLQQERTCPVWGWADPGEEVTVTIAGQRRTATAGPGGAWRVQLDPIEDEGPHTLTVRGRNTLVIQDVLVGEVWLCSGQSNMEMGVSISEHAAEEREAATYPRIRMFTLERTLRTEPADRCEGKWVVCSPGTVFRFSAVAYFFGRDLRVALDRPIGLLNASWGGTPIEAWTSHEAMETIEHFGPILREMNLADRTLDPSLDKNLPTTLFNGMIHPLIPYTLRGVIWYQGESNATTPLAPLYGRQLETLIRDWRGRWGADVPFAWVQLPEYEPRNETTRRGWCIVREEMVKALRVPRTGMAVTLGLGDADDVHPKAKQGVGHRLSRWALAEVYGVADLAHQAPLYAGHTMEGDDVRISFDHAAGGLSSTSLDITGFVICGADRRWVPAQARIEWDTVEVWSPEVPNPVAVRYAWDANPEWSLVNGADLPASPFRTDDWEIPLIPEVTRDAAVPPVHLVRRSAEALVLDGRLDEAFWDELPRHTLKPLDKDRPAVVPTVFHIARDADHLYLGIRCFDPDMANVRITAREDGDRNIWYGDCIELLLETQDHAYYQLAISPAGALVDLDREPGLQYLWASNARVAAHRDDESWTVELQLPILAPGDPRHHVLNGIAAPPPTEAAPWHFNLCRQRIRGEQPEYSAFAPPGGNSYHDRSKFARLVDVPPRN